MLFEIKVAQPGAGVTRLRVEADNQASAVVNVQSQGYIALAVSPVASTRASRSRGRFSLMLFTQELLALLGAGLSLIEGLETLVEKEQGSANEPVLQGLLEFLYQGVSFSEALEKQPQAFPAIFVATVRASEKTGDLAEALGRYVAYETQFDVVRKKIIAASIYPLLLISVGGLVVLFLLAYVVPRFSVVFADSASELPAPARLLLAWGNLVSEHGSELLVAVVMAMVVVVWLLTRVETKQALARLFWRLPAFGERLRLYHLARFYRTLGMIQRGGIPLIAALNMAGSLLPVGLRANLALASSAVEQGQPLSGALAEHGLTTSVALRMLRVGERSGRMAEMLERIGDFYDEDLARWVDVTIRLLEPVLMVVIGFIIGGVVLVMYLPIFELAGSVQ